MKHVSALLVAVALLLVSSAAHAAFIIDGDDAGSGGAPGVLYNGATGSFTATIPLTTSGGYNNSNQRFSSISEPNGGETAVWTFTGLASGNYEVYSRWSASANRATAAPYELFDGTTAGTLRSNIAINQELVPDDLSIDDGQGVWNWELLDSSVQVASGTLTVRLTSVANAGNTDFVIADAVRVSQVIPEPASLALLGLGGLLMLRRRHDR